MVKREALVRLIRMTAKAFGQGASGEEAYRTEAWLDYQALESILDDVNARIKKKPIVWYECIWDCPPDCDDEDVYGNVPHCPKCNMILGTFPQKNYCCDCGEAIDWSKDE